MGLLDTILGRSKQKPPNLDRIFGLSDAAITLQLSGGFTPTGVGSVCYRAAEGGAFAQTQSDVQDLLDADGGPKVERVPDAYGFTWLVSRHDPEDVTGLVTEVHAVNSSLTDAAVLAGRVHRRRRPQTGAGVPVQARHLLPVLSDRTG